ncbi:response regulator [Oscillospiraceae bacterium OttesenSCG-928-G22]|nr:response regulator [Oscillospiraceae bacterium OttesenSCG-928-G22]
MTDIRLPMPFVGEEPERIAVFDFCLADCRHTASVLRAYFDEHAQVDEYTDPQCFLGRIQATPNGNRPYSIIFVAVDDERGMDVADAIRETDQDTALIFLSGGEKDYSLHAFRLHALDYIVKPASPEKVDRGIRRYYLGQTTIPGLLDEFKR